MFVPSVNPGSMLPAGRRAVCAFRLGTMRRQSRDVTRGGWPRTAVSTRMAADSESVTLTSASQRESSEEQNAKSTKTPFSPSSGLEYEVIDASPFFRFSRALRMLLQVRGRVKKGSVLYMEVGGALPDSSSPSGFVQMLVNQERPTTLANVCGSLRNAAHDPRIAAIYMKITPLGCGYAKLQEIRRHMDYFRASGKQIYTFFELGGEKEFYLSLSSSKLYIPPEAFFALKGFAVNGSFVRGVLEKAGIEPQVERIGEFKSAGDQLGRKDMSDAQRMVLKSLLDSTFQHFCSEVSKAKPHLSPQDVADFLDRAPQGSQHYKEAGLVSDVKYEDELIEELKLKYGRGKDDEAKVQAPLRSVALRKYLRTSSRLLGLVRRSGRKNVVALIRANGAINSGRSGSSPLQGDSVGSETLIELLRQARNDKRVKAVILRVDSPGGSALASDVMWRELRKLREKKPVIASMGDVAASGGYYLSMACDEIVAEERTLTGSIGVVTAKLSLEELFKKIGFVRENLSRGKYAELFVDNRSFTREEAEYFRAGAERAYNSFISKAALSRGKGFEELNEYAQGRVWSGAQALERGLVDHLGGIWKAVDIVRQRLDLESVRDMSIVELRAPSGLFKGASTPLSVGSSRSILRGEPLAMCDVGFDSPWGLSPVELYGLDALLSEIGGHSAVSSQLSSILGQLLPSILR
ncbi:Serine protease SPPA, chloroplastic [Porphyridium purpureum]|uniref:Serine protease SPPA, chloroplastic n=1 Tax=Porphyridium purpureum TaxID=35688 RepID=A0A5J4Z7N2_PORPP|nr:Serine protease SPPA, chloroplastic [Porphyridium purpureum]|eukprot:POR6335..scf295_1